MQLSWNGAVLATQTFAVTPQNPGLFVGQTVPILVCGATQAANNIVIAVALNQDGSVNTCANPAPAGSQFTLFVNGIGFAAQGPTGVLTSKFVSDDGTVVLWNGTHSLEVDAFGNQPGAPAVAQVTGRVPQTITALGAMSVTLSINGEWASPLLGTSGGNPAIPIPVMVFVRP
jgi:uncharacterized protein (TIGR03437 family)